MMHDITLDEFNQLTQSEQQQILAEYGVCVGEKTLQQYKFALYQISSFYAEVKYHLRRSFIHGIYAFETTDLLTIYIEDIDISVLL